MARVDLRVARRLCTDSELKLVWSSRPDALSALGAKELKKRVTLARRQRDKWRDNFTRQRRGAQQALAARVPAGATRSAEKAQLFDAVLARFEDRLDKVSAKDSAAATRSGGSSGGTRGKKSSKAAKKAGRARPATRAARAPRDPGVHSGRGKPARNAAPKVEGKAVRKAAPKTGDKAGGKAAEANTAGSSSGKPAGKRASKRANNPAAKPAKPADMSRPTAGAAAAREGRRAAAARARVKASGATTRVRGHVSARGKRSQARRDARN